MFLLAAVPASAQNTFAPPEAPPSERFALIWERSPFTLKTVGEGPVAPGPSFAESFSLAGLSDVGGKLTVYLKNKASGDYLTLADTAPDADSGITLVSLVDDTDPRKVKVRLRKGGEIAEIGYAQEQFQTSGSAAVAPPGAAASALGRSPANPTAAPQGAKGQPGTTTTPPQPSRRRIILPPSGPPQASAPSLPEPVRTALLAPSHAPSSSTPPALRALPSP